MQDFSLDIIDREIERYRKDKNHEELLDFYRDVMSVQLRYREKAGVSFGIEEEELKNLLREGRYLLSVQKLDINEMLLEEIVEKIIDVISEKGSFKDHSLNNLKSLPELSGNNIAGLINKEGGFTPESMEDYLAEHSSSQSGVDYEIVSFIAFTALTPFYLDYAGKASRVSDFSLWSEGFCPVCGQKPMMAKLRAEDNARILECWLCHTQWGFPRLECPFCNNRDHQKLRYFYVDEEKERRVNVCERCKSYLKTVSVKEIGREVILDVENIVTIRLDSVAQKEGYKPGQDLYLLN